MASVEESIGADVSSRGSTLDLHDIQATVLRPRPAPYFGTHVLLQVGDARTGRELVRRLMPHIASAADWWEAKEPG